jgi:hypothetical protein
MQVTFEMSWIHAQRGRDGGLVRQSSSLNVVQSVYQSQEECSTRRRRRVCHGEQGWQPWFQFLE